MAKTTEELVAEAKAAGVTVTVTQRPKGSGEIVLLPGLRKTKREEELLEEDDGSGVAE